MYIYIYIYVYLYIICILYVYIYVSMDNKDWLDQWLPTSYDPRFSDFDIPSWE